MDRHELNQMFDGLEPDPRRERELLRRLLQDDARRKTPMKNWKRAVIGVAAAALLVTGAAAAAIPGLGNRLLEYLGIAPEDTQVVEALIPGGMEVDITKESNGATLHVSQILWDRTAVRVLVDFTAPEGTVLTMKNYDDPQGFRSGFRGKDQVWPYFIDKDGEQMEAEVYGSYQWAVLEDEDDQDGRCTLMFWLNTHLGETVMEDAASIWIPACDLHYYEGEQEDGMVTYSGDWSFEVPLPEKDIGYIWEADQVIGELDGAEITLDSVYLSPLTLELIVSREGSVDDLWAEGMDDVRWRWGEVLAGGHVTLTTKDGVEAELWGGGGTGTMPQTGRYFLLEATDPTEFQGGTLTLDLSCGEVTIPLDNLAPVEP